MRPASLTSELLGLILRLDPRADLEFGKAALLDCRRRA
jgi:hypothetical protein